MAYFCKNCRQNLLRTVSLHSVVHFQVKSFSASSWTWWVFLLWSIVCLWTQNVFVRVNNEFSHFADFAAAWSLCLSGL